MINYNGTLVSQNTILSSENRAFLYGDAVFETLKLVNGKILFLEDHYFRLMSSMRIVRMEIPMDFTMEYFEEQILGLARANMLEDSARIRFTVYRNDGGRYLPATNDVSFVVSAAGLDNQLYAIDGTAYEADLYKDFYITKQLLSSIKSTNKLVNVTGSIFAKENGLDDCFLLNDDKNVIEALHGNLFMVLDGKLITPPVSEGCVNGVMRKQVLEIARKMESIEVIESPVSPFDLQKADELFVSNVIKGIRPVTKYRKKEFGSALSEALLIRLNATIRLG